MIAATPAVCHKTFTVRMAHRAAEAVFAGTREVSAWERRMLVRIGRCQRNPRARTYVRWMENRQEHLWRLRRMFHPDVASWYDDGGATACGFHATYGVANRTLACGTRVSFHYGGRAVTAIVDDRGPFVGGRNWDLNQNVAAALGFSGVDSVMVRVG